MPTNLPPEYFDAERRLKESISANEKIAALEEMYSQVPKHKGTDKLRADIRRKISKLKVEAQSKKKVSRHESQYHIEKEGDGRVIIVGSANTGKSSLVAAVTHAHPEVSGSPYSTWVPTPGMYEIDNIHLQLIDTPAIDRDYIEPECYDLLRTADIIVIMLDLQGFPIRQIEETLEKLEEGKIIPDSKRENYSERGVRFIPMIMAVNKLDDAIFKEEFDVLNELLKDEWKLIPISVNNKFNLGNLFREIINALHIIRVYAKPPGKPADMTRPFVLKAESTVGEFANKVHHDFYNNLKTARVWGKGVHDGQPVGRDHVLCDGDIIELHI